MASPTTLHICGPCHMMYSQGPQDPAVATCAIPGWVGMPGTPCRYRGALEATTQRAIPCPYPPLCPSQEHHKTRPNNNHMQEIWTINRRTPSSQE